jgi:branched-subunit amino acid ABC-type transport system permease component
MEGLNSSGQQAISGLIAGGLYALRASAVVLICKATDIVNSAKGEMAMTCGFFSCALPVTFNVSNLLTFRFSGARLSC